MRRVAAALVHHPVHDRARAVVTSAITNLDLHDISRSSHTYGLSDLLDYPAARAELSLDGPPVLIVFGTGWGLADSITARADVRLASILGRREDGYNHLSVRAAAAIIFDRLLSRQR